MKRQQFVHRPAMVGDPRRHGGRRLLRMRQTRMRRAKVIDRAHQEHPLVQRQGVACQRPAPARQRREAFPERRVQSLNVGGIDHPVALRPASERLHACRRAIDNAAFGRDHPPPLVALDDLGDEDMAPRTQPGPSALAPCARDRERSPEWPGYRTPSHRYRPTRDDVPHSAAPARSAAGSGAGHAAR